MPTLSSDQEARTRLAADSYADPLLFVQSAYPWGRPGTQLERFDGPDDWQRDFLIEIGQDVTERGFNGVDPVSALRYATSSGHGIGKTVLVAWLTNWLMATRPFSRGTITANSYTQLRDKTWAAVQTWTKMCVFEPWFVVNADRMYHIDHKESWFCAPQSCRRENSEAFAGQHAANSTSWYIFDEASAVPDEIYEVAEGGLTDGEPMMFIFGNPTRSKGKFHRACFGAGRNRWSTRSIDSRDCRFTNKDQISEWISDYGEDSDFVRVRVRGLPPRASDLQFIDNERVFAAQEREALALDDDPLVVGVDVARGGVDSTVFWFRRGADARSIPPLVIPGEETRDTTLIVTKAADILTTTHGGHRVQMMFIDGTGIGGPLADRLVQLGHRNVVEVQFGGSSPDKKLANMRTYMWSRMRDWLSIGAIPDDEQLQQDLCAPGYEHDKNDRVILESKEKMKKRDLASPDRADALGLTFAAPVLNPKQKKTQGRRRRSFEGRPTVAVGSGTGWTH